MEQLFPNSERSPIVADGRVAILMRTKNRPVLLARALASVRSQTYSNWHLHLINDGGDKEELEALVAPYREVFEGRLTVKHHATSLGMEAASNSGLEDVDADYIVVHDDDDSWRPTFLERTVRFLENPDNAAFGAVAARCEVIHEEIADERVIQKSREEFGYWKERIDLMDMLQTNSIPPICLLMRTHITDMIGPFNSNLPVLGDWDYNLRLLMVADIGTINTPLAYYHHRVASNDDYGNTVHAQNHRHLDYRTLYRNSLVRSLLTEQPGSAGLMHVLLARIDQVEQQVARADRLGAGGGEHPPVWAEPILAFVQRCERLLLPPRWVWRRGKSVGSMARRVRKRLTSQ